MKEYGKVHALGVRENAGIFDGGYVYAEEKVDGSQFSFGLYDSVLKCRSHHHDIDVNNPPKMFATAVATALSIRHLLQEDCTYFGEYLSRPKHNVLPYGRVPAMNIVLFDITDPQGERVLPATRSALAFGLGLECVRSELIPIPTQEDIDRLLEWDSELGGVKVEGIVFKNFTRGLVGKYVSPRFKEIAGIKSRTPRLREGAVEEIGSALATEARWRKSWQSLTESGELTDSPKDIGPILKAINQDIEAEATEFIKNALFGHYRKDILRRATEGFPEWYKSQLRTNVPQLAGVN